MPDLMSVQPVAGMGNAPRPTPPAPEPAVKKPVDTGASSSATDYSETSDSAEVAELARKAKQDRAFGDDVLAGPPPSFEASLLEIEGDLERIIKQLDAARERARDSEAIATSPAVAAVAAVAADDNGQPSAVSEAKVAQQSDVQAMPDAAPAEPEVQSAEPSFGQSS